jgi:ABC-type glycerol-3-phosphate transport system substrate-binding protein
MRRLAVSLVLAAALAAACGGAEDDAPDPAAGTTGPTEAQLTFRQRLLTEIKQGKYKCHCTSAIRARERIEKGLAEEP